MMCQFNLKNFKKNGLNPIPVQQQCIQQQSKEERVFYSSIIKDHNKNKKPHIINNKHKIKSKINSESTSIKALKNEKKNKTTPPIPISQFKDIQHITTTFQGNPFSLPLQHLIESSSKRSKPQKQLKTQINSQNSSNSKMTKKITEKMRPNSNQMKIKKIKSKYEKIKTSRNSYSLSPMPLDIYGNYIDLKQQESEESSESCQILPQRPQIFKINIIEKKSGLNIPNLKDAARIDSSEESGENYFNCEYSTTTEEEVKEVEDDENLPKEKDQKEEKEDKQPQHKEDDKRLQDYQKEEEKQCKYNQRKKPFTIFESQAEETSANSTQDLQSKSQSQVGSGEDDDEQYHEPEVNVNVHVHQQLLQQNITTSQENNKIKVILKNLALQMNKVTYDFVTLRRKKSTLKKNNKIKELQKKISEKAKAWKRYRKMNWYNIGYTPTNRKLNKRQQNIKAKKREKQNNECKLLLNHKFCKQEKEFWPIQQKLQKMLSLQKVLFTNTTTKIPQKTTKKEIQLESPVHNKKQLKQQILVLQQQLESPVLQQQLESPVYHNSAPQFQQDNDDLGKEDNDVKLIVVSKNQKSSQRENNNHHRSRSLNNNNNNIYRCQNTAKIDAKINSRIVVEDQIVEHYTGQQFKRRKQQLSRKQQKKLSRKQRKKFIHQSVMQSKKPQSSKKRSKFQRQTITQFEIPPRKMLKHQHHHSRKSGKEKYRNPIKRQLHNKLKKFDLGYQQKDYKSQKEMIGNSFYRYTIQQFKDYKMGQRIIPDSKLDFFQIKFQRDIIEIASQILNIELFPTLSEKMKLKDKIQENFKCSIISAETALRRLIIEQLFLIYQYQKEVNFKIPIEYIKIKVGFIRLYQFKHYINNVLTKKGQQQTKQGKWLPRKYYSSSIKQKKESRWRKRCFLCQGKGHANIECPFRLESINEYLYK